MKKIKDMRITSFTHCVRVWRERGGGEIHHLFPFLKTIKFEKFVNNESTNHKNHILNKVKMETLFYFENNIQMRTLCQNGYKHSTSI